MANSNPFQPENSIPFNFIEKGMMSSSFNDFSEKKESPKEKKKAAAVQSNLQIPQFPDQELGQLVKTQETATKLQSERQRGAFKQNALDLEKYAETIQNQVNLQNQKYTDWLKESHKAQDELDNVQAKYPTLTRADIISNMSIGEKVATVLFTLLGAANGAPPDKNPALAVFNHTLDEMVQNQNMNYERERQNILQSKAFNDQTFAMANENIKSIGEMNLNYLNNQLQLTNAQASIVSDEELKVNAEAASNSLKLAIMNTKLNFQQALYGNQVMDRQYQFERQNYMNEMQSNINIPTPSSSKSGDVDVSYIPSQVFWKSKEDKQAAVPALLKNNNVLALLDTLSDQVKHNDKAGALATVKYLNSPEYKVNLTDDLDGWIAGKLSPKGLMGAGSTYNSIKGQISLSSQAIINAHAHNPLQ